MSTAIIVALVIAAFAAGIFAGIRFTWASARFIICRGLAAEAEARLTIARAEQSLEEVRLAYETRASELLERLDRATTQASQ